MTKFALVLIISCAIAVSFCMGMYWEDWQTLRADNAGCHTQEVLRQYR
jgi:hypothetical protein